MKDLRQGGRAVLGRVDSGTLGILLVLCAALLWSTSGLFVKILTVNGIALTGIRSALAFLSLLPFSKPRQMRLDWNMAVLIGAFTFTQLGFIHATRWTTAANAIALQSAAPAWVLLMVSLARRRVQTPLLIPIALILAGIAVMLAEPAQGTSFQGNLLGAVTGFAMAVALIAFKRINQPVIGAVALSNLGTALVCLLVRPGAFEVAAIPPWEWLSLAYLGAFQIGLGLVCFTTGVQRITVAQGSILIMLEPLLNPVWVFLAIGELPSVFGFAGFGLILSGIAADTWLRLSLPALRKDTN